MVTFSVISDENEKLEMKSIDNGMIAPHCVYLNKENVELRELMPHLVTVHHQQKSIKLTRSDCTKVQVS